MRAFSTTRSAALPSPAAARAAQPAPANPAPASPRSSLRRCPVITLPPNTRTAWGTRRPVRSTVDLAARAADEAAMIRDTDEARRAFIAANTRLQRPPHTPEIELHLAD